MNQKPLPPIPTEEARLVSVGGPIDRVKVALRLFGDSLDPDEVTTLLQCTPSTARKKGDVIPDKRYHRVASTGSWLLDGDPESGGDIERQIADLLNRMTTDLDIWVSLTERFKVDIFCGLFLDDCNRGFDLSPDIIRALSDRHITVGFDIYA